MRFVVDRIEGEISVVINENGEKFNLPKGFLGAMKEGDAFVITVAENDGNKEQLKNRLDNLFRRGSGDDE